MISNNIYLYAKFLYYRTSPKTAIDYLNDYFKNKHGQKAIIYTSTHSFPSVDEFYFDHYLSYIMNDTDGLSSIELQFDYIGFFQELWSIFPVWEVLSCLNIEQKKGKIDNDSMSNLLDVLLSSVHKGWISFLGADEEPISVSKSFGGRTYIDALDLSVETYHHLGEKMTELFIDKTYEIEENSSLIYPVDFWSHQLKQQYYHLIAQHFIHTLFRFYNRVSAQLEHDMVTIRQFVPFCQAAKKSLLVILDETEKQTQFYPKYAGYSQIHDSKKWITTLIDIIEGNAKIVDLGERI